MPKVQSTPSDQGILEGLAGSSTFRDELNGGTIHLTKRSLHLPRKLEDLAQSYLPSKVSV